MKTLYKKERISLLLILFILFFSHFIEGAELKIRVTVNTGNVRLKPSLKSMVIGRVNGGQVLEVQKKIENWYFVNLPPDEKGIVISGYIHHSIVEEISKVAPPQKEKIKPEKKPVISEEKQVAPLLPLPPPQQKNYQSQKPSKKKFFIRLGGGYASKTYSYANSWSFVLYHENGQVSEDYKINSSRLAFDAGFGFFFFRNVGIEVSFVPASGKTTGNFSATFPHPFYFNLNRESKWEKTDLKYSAPEINLNLILSYSVSPRVNIYLSGGGTYFSEVKIENLKVINWNETEYSYFEISTSPEYASYTQSCYGFNVGGGIDFFLMENFGFNVNIRYAEGEAKIDVEGTELTIKPGGIRATAGMKFAF